MRALYLLLISLICSCSFFASKKTDPDSGLSYVYQNETTFKQIKFPAEQFYTSNGIKVVIVPRYDTEVVSYFTIVRVGSKHEQPGQRGLAHLLEHLMFRGSKKFPDGKYDKVLEANGGSNNAYTTQDATVYYASTPADKIEKIIELESDRLTNLTFTQEHFDKEREVVSEERKLRVDESAVGKMYHHMMKENFYGTAYQHDVLGEKDDLKQLSVDDVYAFYRKYYVPNNTTILVVGNVSASGTYNMIEDYYGQLPNPHSNSRRSQD
jgi:zinc protease